MNKATIFLIAALSVFFVQCESGEGSDTEVNENSRRIRTIAVETVTMKPDVLEATIRVNGTVEAYDDATISAEVSGRIEYIAPLGKTVEPGEIIARLDDRMLQAQYEAARVSYELALDTYERQKVLHADSIISELHYRNIRTQRDQAKAQFEQAQKQLNDARIAAPFAGRLEERFVKTGELINPGMSVARIVNTDKVKVTAGVPERYSGEVREGSRVELHFRTYSDLVRTGTIGFAGNVIDPDTRTYPVEIEMPNPDRLVKPEMVVELRIQWRRVENTFVIPRTAIVRDEEGQNVFVVRMENGHPVAELVRIRTGVVSGSLIEVIEGLSADDEVVVAGHRTLNQGDRLDILESRTSVDYVHGLPEQLSRDTTL
jgi:membrane fusion protein, multidrug efflux system